MRGAEANLQALQSRVLLPLPASGFDRAASFGGNPHVSCPADGAADDASGSYNSYRVRSLDSLSAAAATAAAALATAASGQDGADVTYSHGGGTDVPRRPAASSAPLTCQGSFSHSRQPHTHPGFTSSSRVSPLSTDSSRLISPGSCAAATFLPQTAYIPEPGDLASLYAMGCEGPAPWGQAYSSGSGPSLHLPAACPTTHWPGLGGTHGLPNLGSIGGSGSSSQGDGGCRSGRSSNSSSPDLTLEHLDKERSRQVKAALRKERNKEAARRSNLNKKIIRYQLEQRSTELWEENIQLQQDIRDLSSRLRQFRHVTQLMKHVCHPGAAPSFSTPMTSCR